MQGTGWKSISGLAGIGPLEVPIDADPVHLARGEDLVAADDRDVVLGLAGGDAGAAADAGIQVDRHAPGVALALLVLGLGCGLVDQARGRGAVSARVLGEARVVAILVEVRDADQVAAFHAEVVLHGRQAPAARPS